MLLLVLLMRLLLTPMLQRCVVIVNDIHADLKARAHSKRENKNENKNQKQHIRKTNAIIIKGGHTSTRALTTIHCL